MARRAVRYVPGVLGHGWVYKGTFSAGIARPRPLNRAGPTQKMRLKRHRRELAARARNSDAVADCAIDRAEHGADAL